MVIHNNILSVTVPELIQCDIDVNTIKKGLQRNRTGENYCWEHHKEGKRVYVHYEGLKDTYKALIKQVLCDGVEPALWLKNQEAEKLNRSLLELCNSLPNLVEVSADDIRNLNERKLFEPTDVHKIARAAGWLRLWRKMDVKTARKHGFASVKEIQKELFKCCLNDQVKGFVKFPKPINNERVLDRKAREYAKTGLECLISGCFGNVNRELIDNRVHALLMTLAGNPVKLSFEDIGLYYNSAAEKNGLPKMTVSAIKHHLNKPKNKRVWMYARHGKHAADSIFHPEIERDLPSRPDALWSLDGTTMQLYYRDSNGKIKSDLYVYFVTDVYSSAIIGYSVAFSETSGMVAEALKNAIDTHGYKPYQLQYDGSSANVSEVIQSLMNNMSRVHFACKPYHGQGKYVETYIGHFQQRVLRKNEAFKGGNITATSLNSKANPDLLKRFKKNPELLLTESEIIAQFGAMVDEWNARGEKRDKYGLWVGESKLQRYQHAHADRVKLNYFEKISLFFIELKKTYEYKKQGIEVTISGKKYKFIVPDIDQVGDFEFSRLHLGESFQIRMNPLCTDFISLYQNKILVATAHEKERYASCAADLKDRPGQGIRIKLFIEKQEQYGYEHAMSEMQRQREELEHYELKATGTDGFGFGWQDTSKPLYNKIENYREDVQNNMADANEITNPALRALLNM